MGKRFQRIPNCVLKRGKTKFPPDDSDRVGSPTREFLLYDLNRSATIPANMRKDRSPPANMRRFKKKKQDDSVT